MAGRIFQDGRVTYWDFLPDYTGQEINRPAARSSQDLADRLEYTDTELTQLYRGQVRVISDDLQWAQIEYASDVTKPRDSCKVAVATCCTTYLQELRAWLSYCTTALSFQSLQAQHATHVAGHRG
jgi:hypothetical protein